MAHNLKLEIFRITLKRKGGSNSEIINFEEYFEKAFNKEDKDEAYKEFLKAFIAYFKNAFVLNADKTKGLTAREETKFSHRSIQNIIDGEVVGGTTGIVQTLYNQKNAKLPKGNIDDDDVSSLPYYIKIWTPLDYNTGVLMVQSYSNHTVTTLVKTNLTKLFHLAGYSLIITSFIPDKIKEKYKSDSKVYKVAFVKDYLAKDKRKLANPLFAKFENLKVKIEFSGFKEDITDFWNQLNKEEKMLNSNLEDFDIKENEDYEVIAYYKDEEGHRSNAAMKKNLDISPTIFLTDAIKQSGTDYYDFKKIKAHTDDILTDIKKEIKYLK